jgi:hypothetical protein
VYVVTLHQARRVSELVPPAAAFATNKDLSGGVEALVGEGGQQLQPIGGLVFVGALVVDPGVAFGVQVPLEVVGPGSTFAVGLGVVEPAGGPVGVVAAHAACH